MTTKPKSIFTTHDISNLLQVNPRSVINWIEQDLLASFRTPGGHRRVRRDDLLAFLRRHQIPTPAPLVEGKFNILIVEDEEDITKILKTFFDRQGSYSIHTASDGISALIDFGRIKPDLIILDIRIPGVDGIEVCRKIKSEPSNKAAIVAISGQPDWEEKVMATGADAFMAKPVDLQTLHETTKRLLRVL